MGLVGLYQSEKTLFARPQLGTEPAGVFMGGTSLDLRLGGAWLDRLLTRAPFLRSNAESHFNLTGEVAFSAKNPNKRGQAWLDDFEGTDEVGLSVRRQDWKLGSRPESQAGDDGVLPAVTDATTTARLVWQHDFTVGGTIGGSLYAQRDIDNQIVVVGNATPEPVMWLTFGDSASTEGERLWRSMTTVLSTTGRDMSRSEYFEFYARAGEAGQWRWCSTSARWARTRSTWTRGPHQRDLRSDGRPWGLGLLDEEARVADREVWGLDKDRRGLWDQPCLAEGIRRTRSAIRARTARAGTACRTPRTSTATACST